MKKLVLIGSLVIVAVVALAVAGFAYAQEPQPTQPVPFGQGYGPGMMGRGGRMGRGGMMGGWNQSGDGQYGPMHEYMVGAMAEALGMTDEDLDGELATGKTMWQVAEAKGLSVEEFQNLMVDARQAAVAKMVADGVLTQEQADWMLSRMQGMWGQGGAQGGCPMHGGGYGGGRTSAPTT
jgi:hypothetical protein